MDFAVAITLYIFIITSGIYLKTTNYTGYFVIHFFNWSKIKCSYINLL